MLKTLELVYDYRQQHFSNISFLCSFRLLFIIYIVWHYRGNDTRMDVQVIYWLKAERRVTNRTR